jgi:hypothetical protein
VTRDEHEVVKVQYIRLAADQSDIPTDCRGSGHEGASANRTCEYVVELNGDLSCLLAVLVLERHEALIWPPTRRPKLLQHVSSRLKTPLRPGSSSSIKPPNTSRFIEPGIIFINLPSHQLANYLAVRVYTCNLGASNDHRVTVVKKVRFIMPYASPEVLDFVEALAAGALLELSSRLQKTNEIRRAPTCKRFVSLSQCPKEGADRWLHPSLSEQ